MKTAAFDRRDRTAVRHGELNAFLTSLRESGFTPTVTDAAREDLGKIPQDKRLYGVLEKGDKILFIEAPGDQKMPKNFYNIVI